MGEKFCYIHKNTSEIRNKLEKIGLIFSDCEVEHPEDSDYLKVYLPYDGEGVIRINCEENEEMFLALAATRSHSDYMQWFIVTTKDGIKWVKSCEERFAGDSAHSIWRKATVEEIVEYFKDK